MKLFLLRRNYGRFLSSICGGIFGSCIFYIILGISSQILSTIKNIDTQYRQRPECTCLRPELPYVASRYIRNEKDPSFCNLYSSQRGPHQRVISISIFVTKEPLKFQISRTLNYLQLIINDIKKIYGDGFLLRVYHDETLNSNDVICPIECKHSNVDFCDMSRKKFIPPKIWRFIPAGDPSVDIMMSRDLDSALTKRERAAVDVWLASNKSFHIMRDHPKHKIYMLGGTWGFRPSLNRSLSKLILNKIHNKKLIQRYTGGADQTFLRAHVWPFTISNILIHDSFFCMDDLGKRAEPFPTQRPSPNETNCYVGCTRTCCGQEKYPFEPCPKKCRPKDHPEWTYC